MTAAAMRAAIFTGPGQARVVSVAQPQPGPQEVRVRLEGCGVCASNLPLWEGREWFTYPLPPGAPGHEGWGRIDAVGPEVQGLAVGQRVALLSSCAYAEYDVAPARAVVPLPASLDSLPYPGEAVGCAMNIWRRSAMQSGQTVAIILQRHTCAHRVDELLQIYEELRRTPTVAADSAAFPRHHTRKKIRRTS